jgi:hypothetical protein
MKKTKTLLLAGAVFYLAPPTLAGAQTPSIHWPWNNWSLRTPAPQTNPAPQMKPAWPCSEYEHANNCKAELQQSSSTDCQCIGGGPMGWRLDEYYGPRARNLAPRNGGP